MNKYKQVLQETVKLAVLALLIVGIAGGIYFGADMYAATVKKSKDEINAKFTQDQKTLNAFQDQYNKSGEAEKRYNALIEGRSAYEFGGNLKDLSAWLRAARDRYSLKMTNSIQGTVAPSEKPDLKNFNSHTVNVRSRAVVELQGVSDLHIFSFLDDMARSAPGLVRVDMLSLRRSSEMTDTAINNLKLGKSALMVDAKIEFSLVGFEPKETPKTGDPAAEAQGK